MIRLNAAIGFALLAIATISCDMGEVPQDPPPNLDGLLLDVAGTQGVFGDGGDGGPAIACSLYYPVDITITLSAELLVVDWWNHRIRRIAPDGTIDGFIGSGNLGDGISGPGSFVDLNYPTEIGIGPEGDYYVAAFHNWRVKAFEVMGLECSVVAGTGLRGVTGDSGLATMARLDLPSSLVFDQMDNIYVLDQGNTRVRKIDALTGIISTFVGGTRGSKDGVGEAAQFMFPGSTIGYEPSGMVISNTGEDIYLTDTENHTIRRINIATRMVSTIAGTHVPGWEGDGGPALSAKLNYPTDLDIAANGDIYIADTHNHIIRKIDAAGIITTVAGNGSIGASPSGTPANEAMFYSPEGVEFDDVTNTLYIADTYNHQIRKVINP